ncbi:PREDICTED: uncharacterized protein LOC104585843 [Nelumbo nucifera]|uniref:Uncharacterized protein LOC104585843 n=1 Tax=Nelumbo nucifera TaxID=4432 RepID=A0A1U8QCU5_NELNU|nr:PREDICTED: uncharacterized protein LOC104585843 [Nelumbo nucifera]XP_010241149.1 PREDICTED: uncharacterized protein LOC104585843 [Nelumbo nucifera]XP_010241150.1 PREDICTED: uncharacterized protein LOC104585843 [Nelumbo nucifera]XP_010241151.1 PREDICTED: uncharacterized protein LOC104585843 [Nelumbo nucifera]XP_019056125.1 PREDICTED: uncharacterized protein LOC104585843 [Nelumbo nucifera]
MSDMKGSTSTGTDILALHKEWDEALCPICMDHPHNAVLLLCSSHDKGCRSYICDTSYRHSNCLDRFKKMRIEHRNSPSQPRSSFTENPDNLIPDQRSLHGNTSEPNLGDLRMTNGIEDTHEGFSLDENNNGTPAGLLDALGDNNNQEPDRYSETQVDNITETGGPGTFRERIAFEEFGVESISNPSLNLKCPLCRGTVSGWKIVKEARQYLDLKQRSCSREACSFVGNYRELRRHARRVHPTTRPSVIDPSRQRAWRHLEHQREYGDIVSAIRSAIPGAIVVGDYVIENGDGGISIDRESSSGEGGNSIWLTRFFLLQMITSPVSESRGLSRSLTRHRRSTGTFSSRRNMWGENLFGMQDDDDWNLTSDMGEDLSPVPRRRRRFTRSRPDEDQV